MEDQQVISPLRAIRMFCLQCVETANDVRNCICTSCPLYPFRMGKNPFRHRRTLTEEERQAAAARFAAYREKRNLEVAEAEGADEIEDEDEIEEEDLDPDLDDE